MKTLGIALKHQALTPFEENRIYLNAGRISTAMLAALLGRNVDTLRRWAKRNGLSLKTGTRCYPRNRKSPARVRVDVERMMQLSAGKRSA